MKNNVKVGYLYFKEKFVIFGVREEVYIWRNYKVMIEVVFMVNCFRQF